MKDHSHPEPVKCAHDLAWCEKCQKPYCKACGKEWQEWTFSPSPCLRPHSDEIKRWPFSEPYTSPGITWTAPQTVPTNPYGYPPGTILCEHKA